MGRGFLFFSGFFLILFSLTLISADLTDNLKFYYAFEEGSGDFIDSVSGNNLTEQGTVGRVTGKIGDGVEFDGNTANFLESVGNIGITGTDPRTICLWMELDVPRNQDQFISFGTASLYNAWLMEYTLIDQRYLYVNTWGDSCGTNVNTDTNMRHHCVVFNGTSYNWYIDAISIANCTFSNPVNTIDSHLWVGVQLGTAVGFDGIIDELGIWNRTLDSEEISELWNNGDGLPYPFLPSLENATYYNANVTNDLTVGNNVTVKGNISASNGFFSYLGSSVLRILKVWFTEIDVITLTASVITSTNITADLVKLNPVSQTTLECNNNTEGTINYNDDDKIFYGCRYRGNDAYEWKRIS